jgi:hypothetical protein
MPRRSLVEAGLSRQPALERAKLDRWSVDLGSIEPNEERSSLVAIEAKKRTQLVDELLESFDRSTRRQASVRVANATRVERI